DTLEAGRVLAPKQDECGLDMRVAGTAMERRSGQARELAVEVPMRCGHAPQRSHAPALPHAAVSGPVPLLRLQLVSGITNVYWGSDVGGHIGPPFWWPALGLSHSGVGLLTSLPSIPSRECSGSGEGRSP